MPEAEAAAASQSLSQSRELGNKETAAAAAAFAVLLLLFLLLELSLLSFIASQARTTLVLYRIKQVFIYVLSREAQFWQQLFSSQNVAA